MLSWHLPLENFCRVRSREPAFPVTWRTRRSGAKHAVDVCSWAMTHITTLQAWPNIADGQDLYPAELCKVGGRIRQKNRCIRTGREVDPSFSDTSTTETSVAFLQRGGPVWASDGLPYWACRARFRNRPRQQGYTDESRRGTAGPPGRGTVTSGSNSEVYIDIYR